MQSPENFGGERPTNPPNYQQPAYQQPAYGAPPTPNYQAPLPNPTGGYEPRRLAGKRVLKKIDAGSAFKVGAVVYALIWAILGLPYSLLLGGMMSQFGSGGQSAALGGGGFIGMYLGGLIFSAIGGGIGLAVAAFAYNIVAGWIGGLEIEVE